MSKYNEIDIAKQTFDCYGQRKNDSYNLNKRVQIINN
jgi:hypothetical protein